MTTRQSATGAGKAKPKFMVRCGCDEDTCQGYAPIQCDHDAFGMVAAKCDECDSPAVIQRGENFFCDPCGNPCWKCEGVGCRACGETGAETTRRILQNCAELPAFDGSGVAEAIVLTAGFDEEPTQAIPVETMREAVGR